MAVALCVGCNKGDDTIVIFKAIGGDFHSTKESEAMPKDYLSAGDYVCWEDGDAVLINGAEYAIALDGSGQATIAADGVEAIGGRYYAAYPATATMTGSSVTLALPQEETYQAVESGIGAGKQRLQALMVASTAGSTMRFENICALMEFSVQQSGGSGARLYAIEVESSNRQLSGEMTAHYSSGSWSVDVSSMTGGKRRRLIFATPVTLDGSVQKFYMQLPPHTDIADFTVRYYILNTLGEMEIYSRTKSSGATTLSRSTIYTMDNAAYTGSTMTNYSHEEPTGGESDPYIIATSEGWTTLMNSSATQPAVHIELWEDIAVSSTTNKFKGDLDGKGHTITIGTDMSLFKEVEGATVSNLTVASSGTATSYYTIDGSRKCYGALVAQSKQGTYINCVSEVNINITGADYVGGLCGYEMSTGSYSGCRNEGNITTTAKNSGGIVGYSRSPFSQCENSGTINATTNVTQTCIGGIAGNVNLATDGAEADGCRNSGDITVNFSGSSSAPVYIGGIMGNFTRTIRDCSNRGNISCSTTSGETYIGGIAGLYSTISNNISIVNCSSRGTLGYTATTRGYVGGIVGRKNSTASGTAINNCYVLGDLTGNTVSGIMGYAYGTGVIAINNSYYYGGLTSLSDKSYGICFGTNVALDHCYGPTTYRMQSLNTHTEHGTLNGATTIEGGGMLAEALNANLGSGWWSWVVLEGYVVHEAADL